MGLLFIFLPFLLVAKDFSYDPFLYDKDDINVRGFLLDRVNINGKWYKKGDVFDNLLIHDISNRCVVLKDNDDVSTHCIGRIINFNIK